VVAILEVGKSYQLYYRDPTTRSFKPLRENGKKYQVIFRRIGIRNIIPSEVVLIDLDPATDFGSRMRSRKNYYNYFNIEMK
jgi:hypothetical protein